MTDSPVRSDPLTPDPAPLTLGLPGYSYPDLYDPKRLRDLADAFDAELRAADPELFAEFLRYRACQGRG